LSAAVTPYLPVWPSTSSTDGSIWKSQFDFPTSTTSSTTFDFPTTSTTTSTDGGGWQMLDGSEPPDIEKDSMKNAFVNVLGASALGPPRFVQQFDITFLFIFASRNLFFIFKVLSVAAYLLRFSFLTSKVQNQVIFQCQKIHPDTIIYNPVFKL
jgi:hypothetical protein